MYINISMMIDTVTRVVIIAILIGFYYSSGIESKGKHMTPSSSEHDRSQTVRLTQTQGSINII